MGHLIDLSGKRFGRLTVIERAANRGIVVRWRCRCDCGNETIVASKSLRIGETQSCGCLRNETTSERSRTHGMSNTPEFRTWAGMLARCSSDRDEDIYYRDVQVCRRWKASFGAFFEDMGYRPSDDHSLDRIDNEGHYSCGKCADCTAHNWTANCRWATARQQANNRRTNRSLTIDGRKLTMAQAARRLNVTPDKLRRKLESGWRPDS